MQSRLGVSSRDLSDELVAPKGADSRRTSPSPPASWMFIRSSIVEIGKLTRVRRPRGRPFFDSVAGVPDPEATGVDAAVLPASGVSFVGVAAPRVDLRRAGVSFSAFFFGVRAGVPSSPGTRCGNMPWFNSGRVCSAGATLGISVTSRMLTRECVVRIGRCCGFCGSSSSVSSADAVNQRAYVGSRRTRPHRRSAA